MKGRLFSILSLTMLYGCCPIGSDCDGEAPPIDEPSIGGATEGEMPDQGEVNSGTDNGAGGGDTESTLGSFGFAPPTDVEDTCPDWTRILGQRDGKPVCELNTDHVAFDRVLSNMNTWFLNGHVVVGKNGYKSDLQLDHTSVFELPQNSVTLTIEAGTRVVGDDSSVLVVARGANIQASGTSADPIIFESVDSGFDGNGEWGGILVLGLAPNNNCPIDGTFCNLETEGDGGLSGGAMPNDSNGRLSYVVIAETGHAISEGIDVSGLTLASVGSTMMLDHIQIHNSADDGLTIYGGYPFLKYIVISDYKDDGLDWSQGYQGGIQYMLIDSKHLNDRGIEGDNSEVGNFGDEPTSMPTIANALVQSQLRSEASYGLFLRSGSGAFVEKSVFSNFDTCMRITADSVSRVTENTAVFQNVLFDCRVSLDSIRDPGGYTTSVIELNNFAPLDTVSSLAVESTTIFGALNVGGAHAEFILPDNFFEATDYIGVVDPNDPDHWWEPWSLRYSQEEE